VNASIVMPPADIRPVVPAIAPVTLVPAVAPVARPSRFGRGRKPKGQRQGKSGSNSGSCRLHLLSP